MKTWTIWVKQSNGEGTAHVSAHEAKTLRDAKLAVIIETAEDWGYRPEEREELEIMGVAEGDVKILEWHD